MVKIAGSKNMVILECVQPRCFPSMGNMAKNPKKAEYEYNENFQLKTQTWFLQLCNDILKFLPNVLSLNGLK